MNDNEPTVKPLRDNAAACRERAVADLKEASTLPTANARRMLESSAATWGARAALLDRLEASSRARQTQKSKEEKDGSD